MKESYFTKQSLEQQARDLYQQVSELSRSKVLEYQPSQSVLLVLDMQSYFLDDSSHAYIPSAGAIVNGILQLIDAFFNHQMPIFFSQHMNTADDAGMMSIWWQDLITSKNTLHRIIPEIDTSVGTIIQRS